MAHYLAHTGELAGALELAALVLQHPAAIQETRERAISLQASLETGLDLPVPQVLSKTIDRLYQSLAQQQGDAAQQEQQ
jgi:hypothetical protein